MRKKPFIAGITRITELPFSPLLAINFSFHVDHLVIGAQTGGVYGFDSLITGDQFQAMLELLYPFPDSVTVDLLKPNRDQYLYNFGLEEMLRRLDDVKPDYVLECESDASFPYGNGFEEDLAEFIEGDYDIWMSRCVSTTVDERYIPEFPISEHCWGYKWRPGINYCGKNSPGFVVPSNDLGRPYKFFHGKSRPHHFPLYTEQLEETRWKFYKENKTEQIFIQDKKDREREGGVPRPERKESKVNTSPYCTITPEEQERLMQR